MPVQQILKFDGLVVSVLASEGACYRWKAGAIRSDNCLEVTAGWWITRQMAERVFRELVMCNGSVRCLRNRLVHTITSAGHPSPQWLPVHNSLFWFKLAELLMDSRDVHGDHNKMLARACEHGEFKHIAGDGLIRQCRKIIGQVDYRKSKAKRNSVALNDDVAQRCVFQIRGTTGAPIASRAITTESGECIHHLLVSGFTRPMLEQVLSFAVAKASKNCLKLCERMIAVPTFSASL